MDNTLNQRFASWQTSQFNASLQDRQDQRQEQFQYRQSQRNREIQDRICHWSEKENAKYYAFLKRFTEKFSVREFRRQFKVFKALSKFIRTRNANQCRSHHHKMTKNFQSIQLALQNVRQKSAGLYSRSEKYFQQLKNIQFNSFQDQQFCSELEAQERRQKQIKQVEINQAEKRGQSQIQDPDNNICKPQDIAFMKTGAVVEAIQEYDNQMSYNMGYSQYQHYDPSMVYTNMNQMNPYQHTYDSVGYEEQHIWPHMNDTQLLLVSHQYLKMWARIHNFMGSRNL